MSWFDTSNFANLAKNALKEAQKTIDKALDIQEEDGSDKLSGSVEPSCDLIETEPASIFTTWNQSSTEKAESPKKPQPNPPNKSSLWGSFTGSFFDTTLAQDNDDASKSGVIDDPNKSTPNRLSFISNASSDFPTPSTPDEDASDSLILSTSEKINHKSSDSIEIINSPSSIEIISSPNDDISDELLSRASEDVSDDELVDEPISFQSQSEGISQPTVIDSTDPERSRKSFFDAITRPPGKIGLITQENLINTQPQVSNECLTALAESPNVINPSSPLEDGVIVETLESSTETVTDSGLVRGLLADALVEKRSSEISPRSSTSHSDLVKIESEHASDHTSGDELETTTSSDIEVISSLNGGDSSSTQSRQSPAKFHNYKNIVVISKSMIPTLKGHNRELSEASSSDDSQCEIEKLLKRLSDMNEMLEIREAKLVEVERKNLELCETNSELKRQLHDVVHQQNASLDLNQVTEEYTQRMSALERKFQQTIRERDNFRKQLESLQNRSDIDLQIQERDETIKELREEGEKLSKIQLQQSNVIKKLRSTEKETSSEIKRLRDQIEEMTNENERLKRALTAKEELERSQIEVVHQLTSTNNKIDRENSLLKSQLDDTLQRLETVKTSLDAAKKELSDKNQTANELVARSRALAELESAKLITQSQNEEILCQLEDLREKLRRAEQEYAQKELVLRHENEDLLHRLEASEGRNEELAESISLATKPLIRQLDNLQATYNHKQTTWEMVEQELLEKLNEANASLTTLSESERVARQECAQLRVRVTSLETNLNSTIQQNEILQMELEQLKTSKIINESDAQKLRDKYEMEITRLSGEINQLTEKLNFTKEELANEKITTETQKRLVLSLQEQVQRQSSGQGDPFTSSRQSQNSSPTPSIGRLSLTESLASVIWPQDDTLECGASASGRNVYDNVRGNPTAVLESLQSTLKLRDGEIQQLQWEMARRENERTILTNELASLTNKLDLMKTRLVNYDRVQAQLADVTERYEAMCQMYGEQVEQVEELKLDLQDVKEMYKAQIDELLQRNNAS